MPCPDAKVKGGLSTIRFNALTANLRPVTPHLRMLKKSGSREHFVYANRMRFCVKEYGNPRGPAILMISGLAWQLTSWPESLLQNWAEQGFRVICFDNRDIGLSDKFHSQKLVNTRIAFLKAQAKLKVKANYDLFDMAKDTSELITALGLRSVHVVGASMGGMVAQILAAQHPNQVRSLGLLMTSTLDLQLPLPERHILKKLKEPAPARHNKEAVVQHWLSFWRAVKSPDYPADEKALRHLLEANYRRSYCPEGALRQLQAIIATGSLRRVITRIQCPTLILHGEHDPFVHPIGGRDIQRYVRGSRFRLIPGMGHDLPEPLISEISELLTDNMSLGASQR